MRLLITQCGALTSTGRWKACIKFKRPMMAMGGCMKKTLMMAIQDCATYKHGHFVWRPKSMLELQSLGYARQIPHAAYSNKTAWEITESGHAAFNAELSKKS